MIGETGEGGFRGGGGKLNPRGREETLKYSFDLERKKELLNGRSHW